MLWIWIAVAVLSVGLVLALLAIGHLHNEVQALRRRHEALLLNVTMLQERTNARSILQ